MKRILLMIGAAMFAATAANAATIVVDTDKATYNVGEQIIVTITFTAGSGEKWNLGNTMGLEMGWDPTVASVANAGGGSFGYGTQALSSNPLYPGTVGNSGITLSFAPYFTGTSIAGAPPNPLCSNNGYSCQFMTQTHVGAPGPVYSGLADAGQVLTATLVLNADAVGPIGLYQFVYNQTWGKLAQQVTPTLTTQLLNAEVVPEPGTLMLLGAGMAGLLALGRRKRN